MWSSRSFSFWVLSGIVGLSFVFLIAQTQHAISFVFAFLRNPQQVGSLMPSSRFVTREGVKAIGFEYQNEGRSLHILEVGAGTGVFTHEIAIKLRPQDHLDVIELEPELCTLLRKKIEGYPNITLHCISILDWHPAYRYDAIISSLPFNVFPVACVRKILDRYKAMLATGGTISYIEYIGGAWVTALCSNQKERKNVQQIQELLAEFRSGYDVKTACIWINVPPAYVYHLKCNQAK